MPSRTTLTLLHKEAKKRVFLQGTVNVIMMTDGKLLRRSLSYYRGESVVVLLKHVVPSQSL